MKTKKVAAPKAAAAKETAPQVVGPKAAAAKSKTAAKPDPSSAAYKKNIENHKKAAEHLSNAAQHHLDAAKHFETGNYEKAAHSTVLAYGHKAIAGDFLTDDAKHHAQQLKRTAFHH